MGDLWGWNESQSLVVFEGDWSDLKGLYLDGSGHREPLLPAVGRRNRTQSRPSPINRTKQRQPHIEIPAAEEAVVRVGIQVRLANEFRGVGEFRT